jgi:group I intron endonuclease
MSGAYIYNKHIMLPYIYLIKNQQNKIVYIGQQIGTKSIEEYKGSGLLLNRAYKKYGENYFKREIIEYCSVDELNDKEKLYIKQYNTKFPHGYNLTEGGDGMKGYQYTNNQKQNISKSKVGQKYPKEHGEKIRQAKLGKKRDQNTINRIIQTKASKYNIQPNLDLKGQYKSNSQKSVIQYDLQNNLINEYQSAQDAGRCLNKSGNQIADCAAGRQKTAYGYIWKYLLL